MVHAHGTDTLTIADINRQINNIFASNNVVPDGPGEEAFWNAVEDVEKLSTQDAVDLVKLSNSWLKLRERSCRGKH